jgi:tetratricopeptide (TPR) repeat protein
MGSIVARESALGRLAGDPGTWDQDAARVLQLSSWMMILGTVRLVCAAGDYASAFLTMNHAGWPTLDILTGFLQQNSLPFPLVMSWPLILGLALRRPGNPIYLGASALTFFILGLGGILQLVEGLSLRHDPTLIVGSFTVSRVVLVHSSTADLVRVAMGVIQLTLELATAVYACYLAMWRGRIADQPASHDGLRRRLRGRLAIYLSLAFLVLSMRMPLWTAYIEVLNRSSRVRDFVISTAPNTHNSGPRHFVTESRPVMEWDLTVANAVRLASMNRVPEAIDVYRHIMLQLEATSGATAPGDARRGPLALVLNNLAWALVTCEESRLRRPDEAYAYAQRAVKLAPDEGTYWNTLGAVYFRIGNWQRATEAMHESMRLRGGEGDAFDWFFLAMIEARQGKQERAHEWYDKAVDWYHHGHEADGELYRFQVEAAKVLGLPRPSAPEIPEARARAESKWRESPAPLHPRMPRHPHMPN